MKLKVTSMWWSEREKYAVRLRGSELTDAMIGALSARGAKVGTSRALDTRLLVPADAEAFRGERGARVDRQGAAGDRAALRYSESLLTSLYAEAATIEQEFNRAGKAVPSSVPSGGITVESLWTLYEELNRQRLKTSTLVRNRNQAKPLIKYFDTVLAVPASEISVAKAERYVTWRLDQGVSPRTVHGEASFMLQLLGWAVDRSDETGLTAMALRRVPEIRGKKGGKRRKVMLTAEQFFALYDAARRLPRRGDILRRIIAFGVCSRARKTPLLTLDAAWVDRRRAWLTVPAPLNKGRGDDYHEYSVPLPRFALAMVEDLPSTGPAWPSMFQRPTSIPADAIMAMISAAGSLAKDEQLRRRDAAIVTLTKRYRVRIADVIGLDWSQVNLVAGWVERVRVVGGRAETRIVLNADDVQLFTELRDASDAGLVFRVASGGGLSLAFVIHLHERVNAIVPTGNGTKTMTAQNPRSLHKACDLAGVPRISWHDLRRTGNHILESHRCEKHLAPVPKYILERLLCHSRPAMDEAYSTITESMMREAVEIYDELWEEHCGSGGDVTEIAAVKARA